jgi:CDP-diacylglycerol--serine O-phosphatidyltransferase
LPALVLAFLVTVVIGALMVSRFSYWSGKELNLRGRVPWAYAMLIPLAYVVISLRPAETLFGLFGIYAASAPLYWVWRKLRRRDHAPRRNMAMLTQPVESAADARRCNT